MGIIVNKIIRYGAVCDHCGREYKCMDTEQSIPNMKILLESLKLDKWKKRNGKVWCTSNSCQSSKSRERENKHLKKRNDYYFKHGTLNGFYND
jgi:hypothetical protein